MYFCCCCCVCVCVCTYVCVCVQEKLKLRRPQVMSKKQVKLSSGDPGMLDSTNSLSANNSPQSGTPPVVDQEGTQPKRSLSGEEKR